MRETRLARQATKFCDKKYLCTDAARANSSLKAHKVPSIELHPGYGR